jgi:uncharacterized membrane protein
MRAPRVRPLLLLALILALAAIVPASAIGQGHGGGHGGGGGGGGGSVDSSLALILAGGGILVLGGIFGVILTDARRSGSTSRTPRRRKPAAGEAERESGATKATRWTQRKRRIDPKAAKRKARRQGRRQRHRGR